MAACKCRHLFEVLLVLATILIAIDGKSAKKNPASDYFDLCRRRDPNINECIKKNINDLRQRFIEGIPDLRLAPLDPLTIEEMMVSEGEGNFRFTQTMKNITLRGLGAFNVKSVDYMEDGPKVNMGLTMTVPTVSLVGDYNMEGRILVLPIKGDGKCSFEFENVTTTAHISGRVVTRAGVEHIVIDDFKWDIQLGGARFHFTNLFNGDKLLGDTTNRFLNENWEEAYKAFKHMPEAAFAVVFKGFADQVFKRYTLNELFPE